MDRNQIVERLAAAREAYAAARAALADGSATAEQSAEAVSLALEINDLTASLAALPAEEVPVADVVTASSASDVIVLDAPATVITAAADVPGHATGSEIDMDAVARAVTQKASSLRGPASGRHEYRIAQIQKNFSAQAVVTGTEADKNAISFATSESNIPGANSLVAAGGWCAPSETWYDLLDLSTTAGLISLPEVVAARGGIRLIPGGGAQFAEIYADTGFCFTEAMDIAGDYVAGGAPGSPKPCYHVECPEFEDFRLDVCGICVQAGYLQNKAYPELTADVLRKTLTAHRHRLSANKINAIVAGSSSVAIPNGGANQGAAAPVLNAVELQVWDIRYRYRMSDTQTLEAVFPFWAKGLFRADLAFRLGKPEIDVPDAEIMGWFRQRGIAAQFVYNWQDLGGVTDATAYPESLSFLIYPAGTWVAATSDVIDLGVVHDSTQFSFNNYTAAFVEEGWQILPVGPESRIVELAVCPSGSIGARAVVCADES